MRISDTGYVYTCAVGKEDPLYIYKYYTYTPIRKNVYMCELTI